MKVIVQSIYEEVYDIPSASTKEAAIETAQFAMARGIAPNESRYIKTKKPSTWKVED